MRSVTDMELGYYLHLVSFQIPLQFTEGLETQMATLLFNQQTLPNLLWEYSEIRMYFKKSSLVTVQISAFNPQNLTVLLTVVLYILPQSCPKHGPVQTPICLKIKTRED